MSDELLSWLDTQHAAFQLKGPTDTRYGNAAARIRAQSARIAVLEEGKDQAYFERNNLVAALARLFPSGIRKTDIPGWSTDWHSCCTIDLPTGQISYHYHDSHAHLFADLSPYTKPYDGHSKEQVHERLKALRAAMEDEMKLPDKYDDPVAPASVAAPTDAPTPERRMDNLWRINLDESVNNFARSVCGEAANHLLILEREVAELRRQLAEAQDRSVFERNHANQAIHDMQVQEQRAETAEQQLAEAQKENANLNRSLANIANDFERQFKHAEAAEADARELWVNLNTMRHYFDPRQYQRQVLEKHRAKHGREG